MGVCGPKRHCGGTGEGEAWQHIVKEAGTNLPWVNRLLKVGHQVIIANACKLRAIVENESKSDRQDAES
jgi:hypothetical protein